MALHILVPCKALALGKSRLSPMLSAPERAALCAELLRRTLDCALAIVPDERCHLVSADAAAADIAMARRVGTLAEPPEAGLNRALAAARDALCADTAAAVLVLPIDLPLASARALQGLVAVNGAVVAAPDRHGRGTNALYLAAAAASTFTFRFGSGSLAAHRAEAEARGLTFHLFDDQALAFDLDEPEDLRDWRAALTSAPAPRRL
jgi:2-phospho-L-lactate/phosphoenolpyruvate guanylyltransferase